MIEIRYITTILYDSSEIGAISPNILWRLKNVPALYFYQNRFIKMVFGFQVFY